MNTRSFVSGLLHLLTALALPLSLAACGTLELGIEPTIAPSPVPGSPSPVITPAATAHPQPLQWRLVYHLPAEGQLWLAAPDGSQARLAAELPDVATSRALGSRYLAYVLDTRLFVLDPATGEVYEVVNFAEQGMGRGLDVSLRWSQGGEMLAYAAAYEAADGARRVALGVVNGYEQRTLSIFEARPGGRPTPTPPPMPPAPPEPGFANLLFLGYDALANTLVITPVGGQDRYNVVWVMDARKGECLKTIPLYDSEQIVALALSPGATRLAVARAGRDVVPSRLDLYSVTGESTIPESYNLTFQAYAADLRWSPDGESLACLANIGGPGLEASPTAALWVMHVS
ncbi:MAG: hypothetical protein N2508_12055, partial [Anaerolineae bacterium]|nr:hypothetical protein [Anaerolineae bacterium]